MKINKPDKIGSVGTLSILNDSMRSLKYKKKKR